MIKSDPVLRIIVITACLVVWLPMVVVTVLAVIYLILTSISTFQLKNQPESKAFERACLELVGKPAELSSFTQLKGYCPVRFSATTGGAVPCESQHLESFLKGTGTSPLTVSQRGISTDGWQCSIKIEHNKLNTSLKWYTDD